MPIGAWGAPTGITDGRGNVLEVRTHETRLNYKRFALNNLSLQIGAVGVWHCGCSLQARKTNHMEGVQS